MTPDRVWLAKCSPENRRLIRNALEPLGWSIEESSFDSVAAHSTPEGALEVLIIEAPPISGRPVGTRLPTLWLLPPATAVPQVAGDGPHEFIRLPAPCEVIVARCLSLVRATLRERALRRYEREAVAQVNRRRGTIATIAHQLASPLSAVIEYLELLSETPDSDLGGRPRALVDEARRAAKRMAEKVEEMVDITNSDAGVVIEVNLARTDLKPILEEIQQWAVPSLRAMGQRLSIQLESGIPAVCGDKERLCQALRHCIEEASALAPTEGQIEISASHDPEADGFARISVAEHGHRAGRGGANATPPTEKLDTETPLDEEVDDLAFVSAITDALGGFLRIDGSGQGGRRIDICLPAWDSRAARLAQAQAILATPGRLPGTAWVCRIPPGGRPATEETPWIVLDRGESLAISEGPVEGLTPIGRVRDLREPGSLARALRPRREPQAMAA
jgi:hypothetical protein